MNNQKLCCYCRKNESRFSEEHIIPRFMGGSSKCSDAVTRDVCQGCNSILGRHVDGAVARSYFLHSMEPDSWNACFDYDPKKGNVFPLIYFGVNDDIVAEANEEAELWLLPDGSQAWHIHQKRDDSFFAYTGGDPVARRRDTSGRVYIFTKSATTPPYWLFSGFKSATAHFGQDPIFLAGDTDVDDKLAQDRKAGAICRKDEAATQERDKIIAALSANSMTRCRISNDLDFDARFLAKLCIGFGHKLFGDEYDNLIHTDKLRSFMWSRRERLRNGWSPKGQLFFSGLNDKSMQPFAVPSAFVILIQPIQGDIVLSIIFPSGRFVCLGMTDKACDPAFDGIKRVDQGLVFISFPELEECFGAIPLLNFIAWKAGSLPLNEVDDILKRRTLRKDMPALV